SIQAIGTKSEEIPVVTLQLKFKGGRLMDASNPAKAGTANLFTTMMEEDTKNYSAEDFTTALETLGSSIDIYTTDDATLVNVRSLKKNLDRTLHLLEERLLRPR